ncbi:MAG TPA: hypothetical protein VF498_20980 [Anaerolineales bacterium]
MKNAIHGLIAQIDVRIVLFVLLVVMIVLAAGAPSASGGIGM